MPPGSVGNSTFQPLSSVNGVNRLRDWAIDSSALASSGLPVHNNAPRTVRHAAFGRAIMQARFLAIVGLALGAAVMLPADEPRPKVSSEQVLEGLKSFWAKTALPDGSFRPGIDPEYKGMSDSALSDMAPVTYAVTLHRTFGWTLPHEEKTREYLLSRQKEDGAFYHRN